jgi:hypothetical protein
VCAATLPLDGITLSIKLYLTKFVVLHKNFCDILPLFQIIRHFNFLGESKHLKFDQIYIINDYTKQVPLVLSVRNMVPTLTSR